MTIYRDDLERVYALIEKPENWTQGAYRRETCNGPAYCLSGAAMEVKAIDENWLRGFAASLGLSGMACDFNDTHSHSEVLTLLRAAIDRAPVRP